MLCADLLDSAGTVLRPREFYSSTVLLTPHTPLHANLHGHSYNLNKNKCHMSFPYNYWTCPERSENRGSFVGGRSLFVVQKQKKSGRGVIKYWPLAGRGFSSEVFSLPGRQNTCHTHLQWLTSYWVVSKFNICSYESVIWYGFNTWRRCAQD